MNLIVAASGVADVLSQIQSRHLSEEMSSCRVDALLVAREVQYLPVFYAYGFNKSAHILSVSFLHIHSVHSFGMLFRLRF